MNKVMGRNYNTILMNVYKDNKDCFAAHQDNENGWVKGTGFGTLAFGCERPFVTREIATKDKEKIIHKSGEIIELPYPMNTYYMHQVPAYGGTIECVVLNACETEEMGKKLRSAGVPHVVCWRSEVQDTTAKKFAVDVSSCLNQQEQGQDYGRAFGQAVARMDSGGGAARAPTSEASCSWCSGLCALAERDAQLEWRQVGRHWTHLERRGRERQPQFQSCLLSLETPHVMRDL